MTLTRRDLIAQAAALVAGASVGLGSDGQPSPESNLTIPAAPRTAERTVPTADEVRAWEISYNARYKAQHRARNQALLEHMAEDEPKPMRVDHAAAHVEAGLDAALGLVEFDHMVIANARGWGYTAAADAVRPEECPCIDNFDQFMAWHAGYLQHAQQSVDRNPATRPRGYLPPTKVRWLQCSGADGCGWRMEDGAVGVPVCPKCGGELRIHSRPA